MFQPPSWRNQPFLRTELPTPNFGGFRHGLLAAGLPPASEGGAVCEFSEAVEDEW
jgi:hypothetical protein